MVDTMYKLMMSLIQFNLISRHTHIEYSIHTHTVLYTHTVDTY